MSAVRMPRREEFTDPSEVIVYVPSGQQPDSLNRTRFIAFWITDQDWVPTGVRGQVFFADLNEVIADVKRRGEHVRVVTLSDRSQSHE